MVWGILMFICGGVAIVLPRISSVEIVIILSWILLIIGVWHLIFAFPGHGAGGVLWQVLLAVLYGAVGIYMLMPPLLRVVSLTLVRAVFLTLESLLEIILYFALVGVSTAVTMAILSLGFMIERR